jgi:hypothetical protein
LLPNKGLILLKHLVPDHLIIANKSSCFLKGVIRNEPCLFLFYRKSFSHWYEQLSNKYPYEVAVVGFEIYEGMPYTRYVQELDNIWGFTNETFLKLIHNYNLERIMPNDLAIKIFKELNENRLRID